MEILKKLKIKRILALVLCIAAVYCFLQAPKIKSDRLYAFYKQHYQECMDGYRENTATAKTYGSGFFKSVYENLAYDYKKLADDDMKKIKEYENSIKTHYICGSVFAMGACCCLLLKTKE